MANVQNKDGSLRVVEELRATWNTSLKIQVHLYTSATDPTVDSVVGDFTEADYVGYVAKNALGWTPAHIVDGRAQTEADPLLFTKTSGSGSAIIRGYWTNWLDTPSVIAWAERFASPRTLTAAGDSIILLLRYTNWTQTLPIPCLREVFLATGGMGEGGSATIGSP